MKRLIAVVSLMSVFLLAACSDEAIYETIEISEVQTLQQQGELVVDVREVSEYESGHIPGAMNKPLSEIQSGDFTSLDPSQNYVIVCQTGNRSQQASDLLVKEGFQVTNVKQGMSSWTGDVE
ncbi:rhodanese-like domain-containing protein [Chryseomicrobium sp. FSL W7-1435]|uniref:rhodanese-like domain-containing protein n=1 Tax=Chryseomicrobium sp. FSL W7-1435 TaxID=2921704 RepID=UPI00315A80D9